MHDITNLDIAALKEEIFAEAESKKINLAKEHLSGLRAHYNKIIAETALEMEKQQKDFDNVYAEVQEQRNNIATKADVDALNDKLDELQEIQDEYKRLERKQQRAYTILKVADLPSNTFNVVTNQFSKMWATTKKSCAAIKNAWNRFLIKQNEKIMDFAYSMADKAQKRIDKINKSNSVTDNETSLETDVTDDISLNELESNIGMSLKEEEKAQDVSSNEPEKVETTNDDIPLEELYSDANDLINNISKEEKAQDVSSNEPKKVETTTDDISLEELYSEANDLINNISKEEKAQDVSSNEPEKSETTNDDIPLEEIYANLDSLTKDVSMNKEIEKVETPENNDVKLDNSVVNDDDKAYVAEQLAMIENNRKNNGWSLRYWMKQMGYDVPVNGTSEEVKESLYNQLLERHGDKKVKMEQEMQQDNKQNNSTENSLHESTQEVNNFTSENTNEEQASKSEEIINLPVLKENYEVLPPDVMAMMNNPYLANLTGDEMTKSNDLEQGKGNSL